MHEDTEHLHPATVMINDVKSGWQVLTTSGATHTVKDNARGLIRLVEAQAPQGKELGSEYAFHWKAARENENTPWRTCTMTPAQKKQADKIVRTMLGWQ